MENPSFKEKLKNSDSFLAAKLIAYNLFFAWGIKLTFDLNYVQMIGVALAALYVGIIVNVYRREL